MSSAQRPLVILRTAMAAGVGLTLLLGGCGTGQHAQTAVQQAAVDGAQGEVGPIAIRNARLAYPEDGEHFYRLGSDAPLLLTIVNTGTTEDELTSVTSSVGSVKVDGQRALPAQGTLRTLDPSSGSTQSTEKLDQGQIRILIEDLAEDVRPGKSVPVTLLFRHAGELTLAVPIGPTDEPRTESEH